MTPFNGPPVVVGSVDRCHLALKKDSPETRSVGSARATEPESRLFIRVGRAPPPLHLAS